MSAIDCIYALTCSGCQLLDLSYEKQIELKTEDLHKLMQDHGLNTEIPIEFVSIQPGHLRDRLDFTLTEGRLGLYSKDHQSLVDIEICQQLSPDLQAWLTDFRKIKWPLKKASFRLRVGPQKQRGLWIDAANIDIKFLLDEKNILSSLQEICSIEIGQKRKVPVLTNEGFKLRDPQLAVWFQSWMGHQPIDLFCQIASFTQPSLLANKKICALISSWISTLSQPRILEFGSGIGNLSFPALVHAKSLVAFEIDKMSLEGFRMTLQAHQMEDKVQIHVGDFQKKLTEDFSQFDLILCNPPRSGLLNFLNPLEQLQASQRPNYFIYMSCFPESLCKDLQKLEQLGYQTQRMSILDQFPQTKHYEVLCLLQRK